MYRARKYLLRKIKKFGVYEGLNIDDYPIEVLVILLENLEKAKSF